MGIVDGVGDAIDGAREAGSAFSTVAGTMIRGGGSRVMDGLSEIDSALTGDESRIDRRTREAGYGQAQAAGNSAREGIYDEQAGLRGDLAAGGAAPASVDPPSVPDFENFQAWGHPEMRAVADTMSGAAVSDAAATWRTSAAATESAFDQFRAKVANSVANGWTGDGASAATATSSVFAQRGASLGPAFAMTASKMEEAASGAAQTNAMVPPPVAFNPRHAVVTGVVKSMLGMGSPAEDAMQQAAASEAARQEAAQVMSSVYVPVYQ